MANWRPLAPTFLIAGATPSTETTSPHSIWRDRCTARGKKSGGKDQQAASSETDVSTFEDANMEMSEV